MKEPPERRATHRWLRRVETGVGAILVATVTSLWLVGSETGDPGTLAGSEMMIPGAAAVALVLAIIAFNGLFVASATVLDLLKPLHVRHFGESSPRSATRLQRLYDFRVAYSAACVLGSHVCRVAMVLAGLLLVPGLIGRLGWPLGVREFLMASVLIALPILLLNLIFELVPKSLAGLHPARWSMRLYGFITRFAVVFSPPAKLVTAIGNLITARFGAKASFVFENQAEEEIKSLVENAKESGAIEEGEKVLLHSVFEFTDTVAREVMTPRVDLDALPSTSEPEHVAQLIEETGHSRIPLYEETDDQIVGVVHAKDLLNAIRHSNGRPPNLKDLMRQPFFVPETKNLSQLLAELRANKTQMAIVQDEFGGTAGVITIEDIVEELVGDIVDEYDEEEPEIVAEGEALVVDGRTDLDDVDAVFHADLESEEFDSIGGYVFGLFGRQPLEGESIDGGGCHFTVLETDGRRILKVRIERSAEADDLNELGDEVE